LAHIAELPGQFQQPDLCSDDLLFLGHVVRLRPAEGRGTVPALSENRAPPSGSASETNNVCQVKFELTHIKSASNINGLHLDWGRRLRHLRPLIPEGPVRGELGREDIAGPPLLSDPRLVLAPDFKPLGFRMSLRDFRQAGSKPPFLKAC